MKKKLFIVALCFYVWMVNIQAQTYTVYVSPTGIGNGGSWLTACNANTVATYLSSIPANYAGAVNVLFKGGDYYNVSINLSASTLPAGVTDIHLIGGYDPAWYGQTPVDDRDWNAYPTILHADSYNPLSNVITLQYFSLYSTNVPSSVESIIITSDNIPMKSNAINLYAGNYVISNCQVTEYNTINRLFMLEVGFEDIYFISSLIDNNVSNAMFGLFGDMHFINLTIADNVHNYFIDGLSQDIEVSNSIMWGNNNLDMNSSLHKVYFSHSFVESLEWYMGDDYTNQWNVDPKFSYDIDVPYTGSCYSTFYNCGDGSLLTALPSNIPDRMYDSDVDYNYRFYDALGDTVDVGAYQHYYDDGGANYESDLQLSGSRRVKSRLQSEDSSSDVLVWAYRNSVCIRGHEMRNSQLSIYAMDGGLVFTTCLHDDENVIPTYLQAGEYVAVIYSNHKEKVCSQSIILQ